jgi:hypothetical protein
MILERAEHPSWLSNAYRIADGIDRITRPG